MGVVLACHEAYVGRETLLSWPVVLVAYAGKEDKKIGKSVRGEMVRIRILLLFAQSQVASGALSHATDEVSARLSKSIVTHVPAQIERGSQATNTSRRLSHCHTTPWYHIPPQSSADLCVCLFN